jgi:hypothetical protein
MPSSNLPRNRRANPAGFEGCMIASNPSEKFKGRKIWVRCESMISDVTFVLELSGNFSIYDLG